MLETPNVKPRAISSEAPPRGTFNDHPIGVPPSGGKRGARKRGDMVCSAWRHAAVSYETGAEVASCAEHKVKRAGYKHGIGRELYTAPFIWVNASDCNMVDRNGKWQCYDTFSVTEMTVEEGRITRLTVVNDKTGKVVHQFGKTPQNAPQRPREASDPTPTADEARELGEIASEIGNKRAVWSAYKSNGIEGARALLEANPTQVELFDQDQDF